MPLFGDYLHYPDGFFLAAMTACAVSRRGVLDRDWQQRTTAPARRRSVLWDGAVQATFPLSLPEEYAIRGRVFSDFGVLTGYDAKERHINIRDDASIQHFG